MGVFAVHPTPPEFIGSQVRMVADQVNYDSYMRVFSAPSRPQ